MKTSEIRETYLSYFEGQGHIRRPSASLVPSANDPTVLLTTAGMQPFKPYFMGLEQPPGKRLTSCQRCFRTTDIEEVGNTARHLTFFEMLGNFSIGDYFKADAIRFGWELSLEGFGFDPDVIWVTVFEGDPELGLGADEEAIEIWRELGVSDERIVKLPRSENFWQAGPTGPCGPCSEMYLDRGLEFGKPDDLPGGENDRFLEYWNHVFMTYELLEDGSLQDLPAKNIDTGMGLERMAAILQGVPSVYDTDMFRPLVDLAAELSGKAYDPASGADAKATRAMRIIADHSRGSVELLADGVVPSNEDRGYILRRLLRRAIQQGRVIGLEAPYLGKFADRVIEMLGEVHPQVGEEAETIRGWIASEEENFGRTLDRGSELLTELVAKAKEAGESEIASEDAFQLHDTFGFPFEMTEELLAEQGLTTSAEGFEKLMAGQREQSKAGGGSVMADRHDAVISFVSGAPQSRFVGYSDLGAETSVAAVAPVAGSDGEALVKLEESPFYAEGGGQVADAGRLSWNGSEAEVVGVFRVGDDQALRVKGALPETGSRVSAGVDRASRSATMKNHTATHLLHAALRQELGTHVRQAGSAVRPDKLRFDFTHGARLEPEQIAAVENQVNEWIKGSWSVRAMEMAIDEAKSLGAMALFGEKYGDWVRMVEVEEVSRELCGGTHVANTAEIGIFAIVSEGSSASNVRRIEAVTGPEAIDYFRARKAELEEVGAALGGGEDIPAAARKASERLKQLEKDAAKQGAAQAGEQADDLLASAEDVGPIKLVVGEVSGADQKAMLDIADKIRQKLGDAAVVLGGKDGGKVALVGSFGDAAIEAGLSAAEVVRGAAAIVGGGGGGRDNVAQAGGRDPEKLEEALSAAAEAVRGKLA